MLGHSIILYCGWGVMETSRSVPHIQALKLLINVIEMPLFMSVSGYVFKYSIDKDTTYCAFLFSKVKRILLPYLFVGLFWMVPLHYITGACGESDNYINAAINSVLLMKSPGQLWFLISLFLIFVCLYPVIRLSAKTGGVSEIALLGVLLFVSYGVKSGQLLEGIDNVAFMRFFYYLFWFYLGFLLNAHGKELFDYSDKYKALIGICCTVAFAICFLLLHEHKSELYYYGAAFFGVLAMYICIPDNTNRVMKFISKNSFGIYLFHSPMVYVTFKIWADANPFFVILFNMICLGTIATLLTIVLRHIPVAFIIGEKWKGKKVDKSISSSTCI